MSVFIQTWAHAEASPKDWGEQVQGTSLAAPSERIGDRQEYIEKKML